MAKILVVEDQEEMGHLLTLLMKELGHEPVLARSLKEAEQRLREGPFALITLDIRLPDGDGFAFCEKLRKNRDTTAVIMLTSEVSSESVIRGFECGASDYLRKPIESKELQARLRGHLKEATPKDATVVELAGLRLDLATRYAHYKGRKIDLARRQFDLLAFFVKRPEVVISRTQLIDALGTDLEIYDRTIDSHISQLRKKLKELEIHSLQLTSVYGVGYRLEIQ